MRNRTFASRFFSAIEVAYEDVRTSTHVLRYVHPPSSFWRVSSVDVSGPPRSLTTILCEPEGASNRPIKKSGSEPDALRVCFGDQRRRSAPRRRRRGRKRGRLRRQTHAKRNRRASKRSVVDPSERTKRRVDGATSAIRRRSVSFPAETPRRPMVRRSDEPWQLAAF